MLTARPLTLLSHWITFLLQALPAKLRPTLLELLIGAMISGSGHLTDALLCIRYRRFWNSYHKAIEKGHFSWLALAKQWILLLLQTLKPKTLILIIDDFTTPRSSRKAPCAAWHHEHSQKPNRPQYLFGQLRVCLSMVAHHGKRFASLPLMHRLVDKSGNSTKLDAARLLLRLVRRWLPCQHILVLLDAWYMKGPLLKDLRHQDISFLGQVRRDTAFYLAPKKPKKTTRGRPRKYGEKLSFQKIKRRCKKQQATVFAYGEQRLFQFYALQAKVRFLNGLVCQMLWCRMQQSDGSFTNWFLLLTDDLELAPEEMIRLYTLRWKIEPMINDLKNRFGLKDAWQQSPQALARWTQLLSLSYGLTRLLALVLGPKEIARAFPIPWRTKPQSTAGWMARALFSFFFGLPVRQYWDPKQQKFSLPDDLFLRENNRAA
jgi:hypothetical protein